MFLKSAECFNTTATATASSNATFSITTPRRHRPSSTSEPCDGEGSGNYSSSSRVGWGKPCPTCHRREATSPSRSAHHTRCPHRPHRPHGPHHPPQPWRGPVEHWAPPSSDFGNASTTSTPGFSTQPTTTHSRHHPSAEFANPTTASTAGNLTLQTHVAHSRHRQSIGGPVSTSANLSLPTHTAHSRPRPTVPLVVFENLQSLEGSSSLRGAIGAAVPTGHTSSSLPTSASAGGSKSGVPLPGSTGAAMAPLARLTGGVERVMVSKTGACFAGSISVVTLLV
jgi:hypothetical protein